ncbi:MAG: nicotinate phosphoribosyltransferase, partial [Clostridium sp.]|nr:nicotinate phosphoribosyltransferase [Clostridium sp.]
PAIQAQFIETFILLTINHQSLIATKSNRIVRAAEGRPVMEFGSRRAQGADGALLGARASYIAGCAATACTMADQNFGSPATGTMAHSWVQMFPDEYSAFKTYCEIYPNNATLLVDTYNVLKSGVPNAIKAFKEVLWPKGIKKCAIRLDSGDLTYLSQKARQMLDEAGLTECKIVASNALDEYIIRDLVRQGARIDSFGVGERLITSRSAPVFGGVYKLVAIEDAEGTIIPKIKISENPAKITTPHFKKVYRIFSKATGKAEADLLCHSKEKIDFTKPLELFDPDATWKRKTFEDYEARELLAPIFYNGHLVYRVPDIQATRAYCQRQVDALWDEVKRFENPHNYYVDLSQELWDIKQGLLKSHGM